MTKTPKTHDLRERLRAQLLSAPDPSVHAACVALLAEIEAALDEADARDGSSTSVDKVDISAP